MRLDALYCRVKLGVVDPVSGDDLDVTWPAHPDSEVEQLFREAHRAGYVIYCHRGTYTLVSPGFKTMSFLGRVVASSGIWRRMIRDLRDWLEHTTKAESGMQRR